MAKIQNPQNERGELLATEKNVLNSLQSLSDQLTESGYIHSNIENKELPTTFDLGINVATNLAEAAENQLADAVGAKNYVDEEKSRATDAEARLEAETIGNDISTWDITTSFSDGATNVFNFACDSPISGVLSEVRLYCSTKTGTTGTIWLEIRQNNTIVARSTNSQTHNSGNILQFNFDKVLINLGERYEFYIVNEDGTKPSNSCLALKAKSEVPEVANLNVVVNGYATHTTRFGFSYYKSNRSILNAHLGNSTLHVTQSDKDKWNTLNSNNIYDKSDNITSVSDNTITFSDGATAILDPENIITAQYAFRTTKGDSSNPLANSQLTSFNLRTVHTSLNGAISDSSEPIETGRSRSNFVEYEQDLLWKDDESYQTLGSLINGTGMFMRNKIQVFNDDLTCLTTAKGMFGTNRELTDFKSPLPSLVNAKSMFTGCRALTSWRVKLPSLVIGANMFSDTSSSMELSSVDTCLPNLTMARQMFAGCKKLTKFRVPSTSFSNLYDAREMFYGCPITSINGNFESLEDGTNMLTNAHLDLDSIKNIAKTIRDWSEGYPAGIDEDGSPMFKQPTISLGIGFSNEDISDENVNAINAEIQKISDKGWEVLCNWNGPADVSTANEINKTFFARLYNSGQFNTNLDENGNPCSIITTDTLRWISDKESWSPMVSSIEEAENYFKLTKIEKSEDTLEEII